MDLKEIGWGMQSGINLAEDRDQCQTPVNMVMNLWVPKYAENLTSSMTITSHKEVCSLQVVIKDTCMDHVPCDYSHVRPTQ